MTLLHLLEQRQARCGLAVLCIGYGQASRDEDPIHMDDDVARGVGLPGKILQGLCTMSFCGRAIVRHALGGDPTGLLRLKCASPASCSPATRSPPRSGGRGRRTG